MMDWKTVELGEVCTLQRGMDLPKRLRTDGQFPLVTSSGIDGTHHIGPVKGPGVITGRYGTIGKVFYVESDFWPLNTTLYVRDFHGNDARFVHYLLQTVDFQSHSGKSGVPGVNRNDVHQEWVCVPADKSEQERISQALLDTDTLIESLEQLLTKKRQIKQGAMQELLTGKRRLEGFHQEWRNQPFDAVLERINVKRNQIQAYEYQNVGTLPVVDQGQTTPVAYSDAVDARFKCPTEGVLIFGDHTCITKFVNFDFVVGADGVQVLVARQGQNTRFHAYQLELNGIESTGYNRHFKFLLERSFLCPAIDEQTAIAQVLSDMDAEISALDIRLTKARALKQAMAQALLTGRIRLVEPTA